MSGLQFTSFHDDFYHPANSKIFFYGDDDPVYRLELLDSYLSEFDKPEQPARGVDTQVQSWRSGRRFVRGEGLIKSVLRVDACVWRDG